MASFEENESTYEINDRITLLQSLWRTEFNSPEVLPFQEETVEEVKVLLDAQQELIDQKVDAADEREYFTVTLYQMDIERVKYSLAKYLRTRITKIEEQIDAIVSSPDYLDRLSAAEKIFATKLNLLNNSFFEESILSRLPDDNADYFKANEDRYHHAQPNLEKFVFCQMLDEINGMYISEDRYQSYHIGDIAVLRYKVVKNYVLDSKIQLL